MKKFVAMCSIAAVALTVSASSAFASENETHNQGDMKAHLEAALEKGQGHHYGITKTLDRIAGDEKDHGSAKDTAKHDKFVLAGTISAINGTSVVVTVKGSAHVPNLTNNQATIVTNTDTKINVEKHESGVFADLKVGQQVVVHGTVSGTTLTATKIRIMMKTVAFGTVTAKTANSITITNSKTGVSQTFTTDSDTDVKINGDTAAVTDVQVGDKGFVKFKSSVSGFFAKVVNLFR